MRITWILKFPDVASKRCGGGTGIDPDIKRIATFGYRIRPGPPLRFDELPKILGAFLKPNVRSIFLHQIRHSPNDASIQNRLSIGIKKRGQGHPPGTLARDAPIRTGSHRRFDRVLPPIWHPFYTFDGFQCLRAKSLMIHANKPLVHPAKDHRRFAAPAVRIAMAVFFFKKQPVVCRQDPKTASLASFFPSFSKTDFPTSSCDIC